MKLKKVRTPLQRCPDRYVTVIVLFVYLAVIVIV